MALYNNTKNNVLITWNLFINVHQIWKSNSAWEIILSSQHLVAFIKYILTFFVCLHKCVCVGLWMHTHILTDVHMPTAARCWYWSFSVLLNHLLRQTALLSLDLPAWLAWLPSEFHEFSSPTHQVLGLQKFPARPTFLHTC